MIRYLYLSIKQSNNFNIMIDVNVLLFANSLQHSNCLKMFITNL